MKIIILLSCVAAGLISTSAIAETVLKAVGGVTGAAIGAGVGAGVGALEAPATGLKSGLKCFDKTGLPIICTVAGALDIGASPVEGAVKGAAKGAVIGSGN